MAKVEHNACLSTSQSSSISLGLSTEKALPRAPPPPPLPLKDVEGMRRREPVEHGVPRPVNGGGQPGAKTARRRSDYVLAVCYVLVYLELAWLIFSLLRAYAS